MFSEISAAVIEELSKDTYIRGLCLLDSPGPMPNLIGIMINVLCGQMLIPDTMASLKIYIRVKHGTIFKS